MKYLISGFFLLFLSVVSVNAQTLSNIDFFAEGKKVIVTYDLSDCQPGKYYDVTLIFVEQSTLKVTVPKTIFGDIKKLTCGSKRIVWDIGADVSTLSGRFYPELEVMKAGSSSVIDIEKNNYKVVKIGTQVWMAENLKTAKYNDGTLIPNIIDSTQWKNTKIGAWCYYDNNAVNNTKYGKLYNWYAVSPTTNGNKNICPTGWHVPTDDEWTVLTDYLGGESVAGGKLKEVGTTNWNSLNTNSTNTSFFTGLPGGQRIWDGKYKEFGLFANWWSSSSEEEATCCSWMWSLRWSTQKHSSGKHSGLSVRCLRD